MLNGHLGIEVDKVASKAPRWHSVGVGDDRTITTAT